VAAEPVKQSWWSVFAPSPRVAFAASMLLLATVWFGSRPNETLVPTNGPEQEQVVSDLPVLENMDVLSNFDALSDLPQAGQSDDASQSQPESNTQM